MTQSYIIIGYALKQYDTNIIKFYSCLQFFFVMYIKYITDIISLSGKKNIKNFNEFSNKQAGLAEEFKSLESYSNEIFKDIIKTVSNVEQMEEPEKHANTDKNDIEFILRNVRDLIKADNQNEEYNRHFITEKEQYKEYINFKGFYHDTVNKGMCLCLTDKWLCSILKIKRENLQDKLKSLIKSKDYIHLFSFDKEKNKDYIKLRVKWEHDIDGQSKRFFTIIIEELQKWIDSNKNNEA